MINKKKFILLPFLSLTLVSCQNFKANQEDNNSWEPSRGLASPPVECSPEKRKEILSKATKEDRNVEVNCSITLTPKDKITKQLTFTGAKASGVVFDCNGASIESNDFTEKDNILIRSRKSAKETPAQWIRPENITIKNCKVVGAIRIVGLGRNGEDENVKESSRQDANHTLRTQEGAPTNIMLDNLELIGDSKIPLYMGPGVTYLTLQNSIVSGKSGSVAIYMDAESGYNTIKNNNINTDTSERYLDLWGIKIRYIPRELIAVDGSSHNKIIGNKFASLNHGGIYLYRNCGEGGTIRHQSPQFNHIMNNIFFYKSYDGSNPSVYLGSREGKKIFCNQDEDKDENFPWGSSVDDRDFAINNVVADNQIVARSPKEMIKSSYDNNIIKNNTEVESGEKRKTRCFLNKDKGFMEHGEVKIVQKKKQCQQITCKNGETIEEEISCK
jgi:parallel beta-helix repeat protein